MNKEEFFNLGNVVEEGQFIKYYDELHCIRKTCDGCKYINECESTEGKLETNITPATRKSISVGDQQYSPYEYQLDAEKYLEGGYSNVRSLWEKDTLDEGYLTDSPITIHKKMDIFDAEYKNNEYEYILYNPDNKSYYCVRQVCSECEHYGHCKPVLEEKKKAHHITAVDLRSQEPRMFFLLSSEPEWGSVFRNDTIRSDPNMVKYLDYIFKKELNVNTDKNTLYWKYLDSRFFYNKTNLYNLNNSILEYKLDPTEDNEAFAQEWIDFFKEDWREYYNSEQERLKKKSK